MPMRNQSKRQSRPPVGISLTVLVAAQAFSSRMGAEAVAAALAAGMKESGRLSADPYELGELGEDFDTRMKAARAGVIAAPRLDESTLLGSLPFEIATRARQAGVPAYAVTRAHEF